ncbi:adenosine receptor A3-like isoform X2 [Pomacea canaliculata]|nr:adenosine receptor A3-like isoform X2 [Pomacea canaliculata]
MVRQGKSREAADLLVAGLALSDALVGVIVLWVSVYNIVYFQVVEECLLRLGLAHSTMAISAFLLLCLSADRFMKIILPYQYIDVCKKWTVWVVMVVVWLLGIGIGSLPLLGWNSAETTNSSGDPICGYFKIMNPDYLRMYSVVICTPICAIIILYLKLFHVARKHAVAIATTQGSVTSKVTADHRHVWRYTKTVFIIVGVYFICWLPLGVVVMCSVTGVLDHMSISKRGDLMLYTGIFVFCNSLLNPIIYAKKIPAIRRRFTAMFCCCRKKDESSEHTFSITNTDK